MSTSMEVRNQYRTPEWAAFMALRSANGLSVREFCVQQGISEQAYYYRLRKMRQQVAEELPQLVAFNPPPLECTTAAPIKIHYCGATLEIPLHNSTALTAVLSALKEL